MIVSTVGCIAVARTPGGAYKDRQGTRGDERMTEGRERAAHSESFRPQKPTLPKTIADRQVEVGDRSDGEAQPVAINGGLTDSGLTRPNRKDLDEADSQKQQRNAR